MPVRSGALAKGGGIMSGSDRRPIRATIRTPTSDPVDQFGDDLREALARWASGVAVLAATDGEELDAITITAFTAVSIDPPLVLASVGINASVLPMIRETGRFTVSVLSTEQRAIASAVADRVPGIEARFEAVNSPFVPGRIAGFECTLEADHPGGDHRLLLGRVERVDMAEGDPLLYHLRGYRTLADAADPT